MNARLNKEYQEFQHRLIKARRRKDEASELAAIDDMIANGPPDLKGRALQDRGEFMRQRGRWTEAKQDFLTALEMAPNDPHVRHLAFSNVARAHEASGELADAKVWYRKALSEGTGTSLDLSAMLRVNGGVIDDEDRVYTGTIIEHFWPAIKLPGKPDLSDLPECILAIERKFEQICEEAMIPPDIGEVIAERKLVYIDENGQRHDAKVEVGRPRPSNEDGEGWICVYRIAGFDFERIWSSPGEDSMHALVRAMNLIGIELEVVRGLMEGEIVWEHGVDGDLGFPLQNNDADED